MSVDVRILIAAALIRSGVCDDEVDLLQWHACADCPRLAGCPCSGVPYLSDAVWRELEPIITELRAGVRHER